MIFKMLPFWGAWPAGNRSCWNVDRGIPRRRQSPRSHLWIKVCFMTVKSLSKSKLLTLLLRMSSPHCQLWASGSGRETKKNSPRRSKELFTQAKLIGVIWIIAQTSCGLMTTEAMSTLANYLPPPTSIIILDRYCLSRFLNQMMARLTIG